MFFVRLIAQHVLRDCNEQARENPPQLSLRAQPCKFRYRSTKKVFMVSGHRSLRSLHALRSPMTKFSALSTTAEARNTLEPHTTETSLDTPSLSGEDRWMLVFGSFPHVRMVDCAIASNSGRCPSALSPFSESSTDQAGSGSS